MILFINCFITDSRHFFEDRGLFPRDNTLDTFKYMLSSLEVIPWDKVYLYILLDENYKPRQKELDDYVAKLWPNAEYHPYRLSKQPEWQQVTKEILATPGDDLVWFLNNHDHIFVEPDLEYLNRITAAMRNFIKQGEKLVSCYFTHWPEMLRNYSGAWDNFNYIPAPTGGVRHHDTRDYFTVRWINNDSVQLVSKYVLEDWWLKHEYGDVFWARTDGNVKGSHALCLMPYREIVRHFDGYSRWNWCDLNSITPLTVPPGFWQDDLKISYLGKHPKPGHVLINPLAADYSCVSRKGADFKWVLEDIPLFWRNKISSISIEDQIDHRSLIDARNQAVWSAANADKHGPADRGIPPRQALGVAFRAYDAKQDGAWNKDILDRLVTRKQSYPYTSQPSLSHLSL